MAHFRGSLRGMRGMITRLGGAEGGIHTTANGLNLGVRVQGYHRDGKDVFDIYKTAGTNGRVFDELVLTISED